MYTFRRATSSDAPTVREILSARRSWLRERNIDQWTRLDPARNVNDAIAHQHTWLLLDGPEALGTLQMSTRGDNDFWSPDELDQPALYLSKLATRPEHAGHGLGELLNDCATRYATERGIPRIRWDVWRSNDRLQTYYRRIGGHYLRTVEVDDRQSGALFESAYAKPRTTSAVNIVAPRHHIKDLTSTYETRAVGLETPGGPVRDPWPDHWHRTPQLTVRSDTEADASMWVSGTPRVTAVLFNAGHGWRLSTVHTRRVTGPALDGLHDDHPYEVAHRSGQPCAVELIGDALN